MNRYSRFLSIRTKVLGTTLFIGLASIVVTNWQAYLIAKSSMQITAFERMTAVREAKSEVIKSYIQQTKTLVLSLSKDQWVLDAMQDFHDTPESDHAPLQTSYHPLFQEYLDLYEFANILLVDVKSGKVVYAVDQAEMFDQGLLQPPWDQTQLSKVFKAAQRTVSNHFVQMTDFESYSLDDGLPTGFIAAPLFAKSEEKVGVLLVQLEIADINRVMTSEYKWEKEGLGESGETYLVGSDYSLRNDARGFIESPDEYLEALAQLGTDPALIQKIETLETTILHHEIHTPMIEAALNGNAQTEVNTNFQGITVLSSYKPLNLEDVNWVIVAEIHADEVFAPIDQVRNRIVILTTFLTFLIIMLSVSIAQSLLKPVLLLMAGTDQLKSGDLSTQVPVVSKDEIGLLARSFNEMAVNLREAHEKIASQAETLRQQNEKIRAELELAADFQMALLPKLPDLDFVKIESMYLPHFMVSGDIYDLALTPSGAVRCFLGDATGHGVSAALMTMMARIGIDSLPSKASTLAFTQQLNQILAKHFREHSLTSICLSITPNGQLSATHAGHPPLVILPANSEQPIHLQKGGFALGMSEEEIIPYVEDSYPLQPHDKIFIYTDGILEWENQQHEQFGSKRLFAFLMEHRHLELHAILEALSFHLWEFSQGKEGGDDITIIGLHYTGAPL